MATTIFLVRHGEVENPDGILYGRLPGFGLSALGREQLEEAGELLAQRAPVTELHASPMQRAQESAQILARRLNLPIVTDDRLLETEIGGYQGGSFDALPRPYMTEDPQHEGIECASSIRERLLSWAQDACAEDGRRIVAVSHRDPIAVILLHWMGRGLDELPGFDLQQGSVYEVILSADSNALVAVLKRVEKKTRHR